MENKLLLLFLCGLATLSTACETSTPDDISIVFSTTDTVDTALPSELSESTCVALGLDSRAGCWINCQEEVNGATHFRVEVPIDEDVTTSYAAIINGRDFMSDLNSNFDIDIDLEEWMDNIPVFCEANQHVSNNQCVDCPAGETNEANDNANGGGDTECDAILCGENERVAEDHTCQPCADGETNPAGDDASGSATTCAATLCGENERVSRNECAPCSGDQINEAGDPVNGPDTSCEDPPVHTVSLQASSESLSTDEDTDVSFELTLTQSDTTQTAGVFITGLPEGFSVEGASSVGSAFYLSAISDVAVSITLHLAGDANGQVDLTTVAVSSLSDPSIACNLDDVLGLAVSADCDGDIVAVSDSVSVVLVITAVNDDVSLSVANSGSVTNYWGEMSSISVTVSDVDNDCVDWVVTASNGVVPDSTSICGLSEGEQTFDITYLANAHFYGVDTLVVTVDDGAGSTATQSIVVSVNCATSDPVQYTESNAYIFTNLDTDLVCIAASDGTYALAPLTTASVYEAVPFSTDDGFVSDCQCQPFEGTDVVPTVGADTVAGFLLPGETAMLHLILAETTPFDLESDGEMTFDIEEAQYGDLIYAWMGVEPDGTVDYYDATYFMYAPDMSTESCTSSYGDVTEDNTWVIEPPVREVNEDGTISYRYKVSGGSDSLVGVTLGLPSNPSCYQNAVVTEETSGDSSSSFEDVAGLCVSGLRTAIGCTDCERFLMLTVEPTEGAEVFTGKMNAALEGFADGAVVESFGPRCSNDYTVPAGGRRLLDSVAFTLPGPAEYFMYIVMGEEGGNFAVAEDAGSSANAGSEEAGNGVAADTGNSNSDLTLILALAGTTVVVVGAICMMRSRKALERQRKLKELKEVEDMELANGSSEEDVASIVGQQLEQSHSSGNNWLDNEVDEAAALFMNRQPDAIVSFR